MRASTLVGDPAACQDAAVTDLEGANPAVSEEPVLPELFVSADLASAQAQRRFLRSTALQLGLLVVAAVSGVTSVKLGNQDLDWSQIVATCAFLAGASLKAHVAITKPDHVWYQARAAAESARTLAWRYAVCGQPFRADLPERELDRLFIERLHAVLEPLRGVTLVPSDQQLQQITDWMRRSRSLPLEDRTAIYAARRIEEEQRWYADRALRNAKQASFWSLTMVTFEIAGALTSLLTSVGAIHLNVAGLAATVVGVATAWMQTKQHQNLASAYAVAARELADIRALIGEASDEEQWSRFVDNAEGAISREHTLWTSSRSR
jgi:hypothetical protein